MKNKDTVFKEYSTALLTIGSVIAGGTFNYLASYVYNIWIYVYLIMNFLIMISLFYLCWRIHNKFVKTDGFNGFEMLYLEAITVVIPFGLGSFLALGLALG